MREILFRGKTDEGEWIEGDLFCNNARRYIRYPENETYFTHDRVIPETVGQYTGLTDKNGKKIFEGDIVKCTDETYKYSIIAVVMFGKSNRYSWGFQLKRRGEAEAGDDILYWIAPDNGVAYIEVIGNIHDNPELLKGGE